MDEDDIDALLREEEEIREELEGLREVEHQPRKRSAPEIEAIPSKTRRSISTKTIAPETEPAFSELINEEVHFADINAGEVRSEELETSVVMTTRPNHSDDYVTIVGEDGGRYYLNVQIDSEQVISSNMVVENLRLKGLTEDNFDDLLDKANEIRRMEKDTAKKIDSTLNSQGGKELWVEKYAPRSYTQLLSQEASNRALLTWLKSWDAVVFGKNVPSSRKTPTMAGKDQEEEFDEWKRPMLKLALLCGPPGVGKTTLAHIAARHCGYSVIEVNSSDDRTPDMFRQVLDSGASTQFSVTGDKRPLCLVLDEIDGASLPAIEVLIQACKTAPGSGRRGAKKRTGAARGSGVHALMRPVICICNDLYAHSLRELRPLALILRFSQMEAVSMGLSLLNVTAAEGMATNINDLSALAERMNFDLRACLNALQFLQSAGDKNISNLIKKSSNKDVQTGLFAAWTNVFTLPKVTNASRNPYSQSSACATSLSQRTAKILQTCGRSVSSWDRLIDGLHEFFLHLRFKDSGLKKVVGAYEWLRFVDMMHNIGMRTQDYSFMKFQAYLPVYFHLNFAVNHLGRLSWPQASTHFRQLVSRSGQILTSLTAGICANCRPCLRTLILDILPLLVDILQPTIRPVNTQLYSVRERMELTNIVNTMIQFGISLRQERGVDGQYDFVLDPDLNSLSRFQTVRQTKVLSYAAKQLIAREIGLEKMRRSERNVQVVEDFSGGASNTPHRKGRRPDSWSIKEQARKVQSIGDSVSKCSDFFGRTISKPLNCSKASENENMKASPLNNKIWFRFKTGYSNAIRRPILIRDLL